MIVCDASAIVEVVANLPARPALVERLTGEELHAPHLLDPEVLNGLRNLVHRAEIDEATAARALGELEQLEISRYPHGPLRRRIWQLRGNLTPYDASYVALAEALEAPLITGRRQARRQPQPSRAGRAVPATVAPERTNSPAGQAAGTAARRSAAQWR